MTFDLFLDVLKVSVGFLALVILVLCSTLSIVMCINEREFRKSMEEITCGEGDEGDD